MTSPTIRPARPEDLPAIVALEASEYGPDAYSRFFLRQAHDLWPSLLLVAVADGSVAGYALGALSESPREGWLLAMLIEPRARRLGLGRALVAEIVDGLSARGCARVNLTVHPSNDPAIGLYRALGFELIAEERDYFGPGEPRLLFSLTARGTHD